MKTFRIFLTLFAITALLIPSVTNKLEAVCYVTDTGGCGYDECRLCTNLAPAIALSTVAIVAIIAIAVQNSHDSSSSSSHFHAHSHTGRGFQ